MTTRLNRMMLERMTSFGIYVCRMADTLPNRHSTSVLARQVIRSSTSIGANYREAQFARTSKEFISKLKIALQEAEETRHWLTTIRGSGHVDSTDEKFDELLKECSELIAILVATINTMRQRSPN